MKTQLNDRVLWFDGTSEVTPERVPELLLHGVHPSKIAVTEMSKDIKDFNLLSDDEFIVEGKSENQDVDMTWEIPLEYKHLDLTSYVMQRSEPLGPAYVKRAKEELMEILSRDLEMVFKTLIYIIDVLRAKQQVWGVGRGSSCASLVLHLIGIHEVDPVKYGIPASEFYHD